MRYLSEYEERLIKLVHLLASGTPQEYGLTIKEVRNFLTKPLKSGKNALEELEESEKLITSIEKQLFRK